MKFPLFLMLCGAAWAQQLSRIDHYVRVQSAVPAMEGQPAQIYVREVVRADAALRSAPAPDRVVLFVHGAGTPAEVAFDVPYGDYSWMAYIARAGFDVFSMDMSGYGRSTRPLGMNDPCNLSEEQQKLYIPQLLSATCAPSYASQMTTIASDWNDIDAVVNHLRKVRGVEKVSLVGWSMGGPRAGGYTAQHPEKVSKLVLLAPAYQRGASSTPPGKVPASGPAFNTQSRSEFLANWDRQVGCPAQYDPAAAEAIWNDMVASDPVGATWGPGVRRAPQTTSWGWNKAAVAATQIPTLMVVGTHDKQVAPASVKNFYEDLGSPQKVIIEMVCASHNAMWEKDHLLLFQASLEWLSEGKVKGQSTGFMELGR
jgi:pimeloyl-ACP methyl ester carboxylesterase